MQPLKQTCCLLIMAYMASLAVLSEGFTRVPPFTASLFTSSSLHDISTNCNGLAPFTRTLSRKESISLHESRLSEGVTEGADDIVACKITVAGDVNGGYYRACVLNEVGETVQSCFYCIFLLVGLMPFIWLFSKNSV
jgi:hypothetical protein